MKSDINPKTKVTFSMSKQAVEALEYISQRNRRNKSNMLEELIWKEQERLLAE